MLANSVALALAIVLALVGAASILPIGLALISRKLYRPALPWKIVSVATVVGVLSGAASLYIEIAIPSISGGAADQWWDVAVEAPLVEEIVKAAFALGVVEVARRMNRLMSATEMVIVGALVGGGFAFYEGFLDALVHWNSGGFLAGVERGLIRNFAGGLHVLTTGTVLYALHRQFGQQPLRRFLLVGAAVAFHAVNNGVALVEAEYGWRPPLLNLAILSWLPIMYFMASMILTNQVSSRPRILWEALTRRAT